MPVAKKIEESLSKSSWIRKMFEEGTRLKKEFGEKNVFDFSLGNPDVNPPEKFFTTLQKLGSTRPAGVHGYMSNAGFPEVREAIADSIKRDHEVTVTPDNILMTCGAAGALNVVLKTILNPGEKVIVPKPYFVEYGSYCSNHGGELVTVNTTPDFSLDLTAVEKALTPDTRAMLINSPNNPTGRIYSEEELTKLSILLQKYNKDHNCCIYLISDEPYREIVYTGKPVPSILKLYSNSILVTSYSKSLSLPGERIGFIAVNPEADSAAQLVAGMIMANRVLGFVNAPALMQRVVAELTNEKVDVSLYQRRRDMLVDGLRKGGYEFATPEGAFYLFCKAPTEDDVSFVQHLVKYNVLAVPGSGFAGPGYFRLAYCVPDWVIAGGIEKLNLALSDWNAK